MVVVSIWGISDLNPIITFNLISTKNEGKKIKLTRKVFKLALDVLF